MLNGFCLKIIQLYVCCTCNGRVSRCCHIESSFTGPPPPAGTLKQSYATDLRRRERIIHFAVHRYMMVNILKSTLSIPVQIFSKNPPPYWGKLCINTTFEIPELHFWVRFLWVILINILIKQFFQGSIRFSLRGRASGELLGHLNIHYIVLNRKDVNNLAPIVVSLLQSIRGAPFDFRGRGAWKLGSAAKLCFCVCFCLFFCCLFMFFLFWFLFVCFCFVLFCFCSCFFFTPQMDEVFFFSFFSLVSLVGEVFSSKITIRHWISGLGWFPSSLPK